MPEDRGGTVRQIAWHDVFPWLSLVRAVRLAAAPRLVLLAALGLALTAVGWRGIGWAFSSSQQLDETGWRVEDYAWPWESPEQDYGAASLSLERFNPLHAPLYNPLIRSAKWLSRPFTRIFWDGQGNNGLRASFGPTAGATPIVYSLLCGLWELAIWSLIGGAITRIAALAMARDDRLGLVGGLKFGVRKWPAYFFAPLVPFSAVLGLLVLGWIGGLLLRWDPTAFVVALLWPILLVVCFGVAVLLLGLLFGWALIWPTISTEGTDSFDGLSRSYSYTFQRPLFYLFFVIVAGFLGVLATLIAWLLADWTHVLSVWAVSWGAGFSRMSELSAAFADPAAAGGLLGGTARLLAFWDGCIVLLALAYVYSYFWTAATRIYFLLRQRVDGTELDEVAVEEFEAEETYGLPALAPDETGMPRVVEPVVSAPAPSPPVKPPDAPSGP
ncbi:MAG TPA: hypothetical protein VHX65_02745 [Pirellulales bacterium]|jgi:hypothetical protein|nr:hypothetical protein [Pirellulales bacterium]